MQSRVRRRSPTGQHPQKPSAFRFPSLFFLGLPTFLLLATVLEYAKVPERPTSGDNHLLASGLRPVQVRLDDLVAEPGAAPPVAELVAAPVTAPPVTVPVAAPAAAPADVPVTARVSAPIAAPAAVVPRVDLRKHLNFTARTALNFMHFHKTGGVTFKTALFTFFDKKTKRDGSPVRVLDACYIRSVRAAPGAPSFHTWRCDWDPAWALPATRRAQLDVVFGHQFWKHGAPDFLSMRDLRTFAVVRHPLARKLSFFFHFFVRERGRRESDVPFDEVRDFLLFDKLTDDALELGSDLGPNYMAGRLLSDGYAGFVGAAKYRHFAVRESDEPAVVQKAADIMRRYTFVALQEERRASMCMLRKTVEAFNVAQGIDTKETSQIAKDVKAVNAGSYPLTAAQVWDRFNKEEKDTFNRKENVDLLIYKESVKMFNDQVKIFGCDHLVKRKAPAVSHR